MLAALLGAPQAAQAAPGNVEIKSVFAMPVDATPYGEGSPLNQRNLCTPEAPGRRIYGTEAPFDPSRATSRAPSGYPASVAGGYEASDTLTPPWPYVPANRGSSADLVPALQAGATNDLCFGFTMTPNVQEDFITGPDNTGQGSKRLQDDPLVPDVDDTHVALDGSGNAIDGDDLKTAVIDMPAGFLGSPDAPVACTEAQFGLTTYAKAACPTASTVGTAFVRVSALLGALKQHLALGGAPNPLGGINEGGLVYSLEHGPNELGRLGVVIQPVSGLTPAKFIVRLQLNPDGSGRVRTTVENAPRNLYLTGDANLDGTLKPGAKPLPLYVESVGIRAWGSGADHPTMKDAAGNSVDFAEWGTRCDVPLSASASIETYKGVKSQMTSEPFQLTGCEALPFQPSVSVETTERRPAVPTATTVNVGFGQTTSGLKTALLKDALVTLPSGLELGAQAGSGPNGLPLCSAAQFGFDNQADANTCPEASRAGSVSIATPLLNRPFVGSVYLGEQSAVGELPGLYIEASPEGATSADAPRIKLRGTVTVDADGRITTAFKDNPQLRFSQLTLSFPGGPNALFTTPRACGTTSGTSSLTSWASPTPVNVDSSLTIDQDCETPGFAPSLSMSAADQTAGASSPTTVTLARADRSPWMKDFRVSLPSGFLANLNVVSECAASSAAVGACPESSRIGTVTATAGVGESPLTLTGRMYFTERESSAVAGTVFVVRAKIGDIDLGDVVVPGRIDLRQNDAGLVLTASAPTRFRGLALNLRSFAVSLDRPGFPLNPTACGPLRATGELAGDGGQTAVAAADVTYGGCGALAFKPSITASLSGALKTAGSHPELKVSVTKAPGESNLRSTAVLLPAGVTSDAKNINNMCENAAFNASACPDGTRVGSVSANVSITSDTITGNLYLVRVAGETLPGIGMVFTGRYAQRVLSKVKVDKATGRLETVFESIPDLPLTKLDLTIAPLKTSPIAVSRTLCDKPSTWDATFGGQGGQTSKVAVPFNCSEPKPSIKWSRKTGIKIVMTSTPGKRLQSAKVTLPKGFRLTSSTKNRKKYATVKVSGRGKGKTKIKYTKTSVAFIGAKNAGPTKITITLRPRALVLPKTKTYAKGLKKGKKLSLKVRTASNDGAVSSTTTSVKVG